MPKIINCSHLSKRLREYASCPHSQGFLDKDDIRRSQLLAKELNRIQEPSDEPFKSLNPAAPQIDSNITSVQWLRQMDAVAVHLQSAYKRHQILLCAMGISFLASFELFAHLPQLAERPVVLEIGIATLLLGLMFSVRPRTLFKVIPLPVGLSSRDIQVNYLNVRMAAELLRIEIAMCAAGITFDAWQSISQRTASRLQVVKHLLDLDTAPVNFDRPDKVFFEDWIKNQRDYFACTHPKQKVQAHGWEMASKWLFTYGVVGCMALAVLTTLPENPNHLLKHLLLTFSPVCLVLAAIAEFYKDRMGFSSQANRYENAYGIFLRSSERSGGSPMSRSWLKENYKTIESQGLGSRSFKILTGLLHLAAGTILVLLIVKDDRSPVAAAIAIAAILLGALAALASTIWFSLRRIKDDRKQLIDGVERVAEDEDCLVTLSWLKEVSSDERTKFLGEAAEEAVQELVEWYVSSIDREIGLPKG